MSEADLKSYNLQMQQVEAALTSDPGNAELLTLKTDLEQVIELTRTLIEQQKAIEVAASEATSGPASTASGEADGDEEEPPGSSGTKARPHDHLQPVKHWQVGEQCQAIWSKNGE